jgi:hypothetical protein
MRNVPVPKFWMTATDSAGACETSDLGARVALGDPSRHDLDIFWLDTELAFFPQ